MQQKLKSACCLFHISDLRLIDHPALVAAHKSQFKTVYHVLCIPQPDRPISQHRSRFLAQSVRNLHENLKKRSSDLLIVYGNKSAVLPLLMNELGVAAIYAISQVGYYELRDIKRLQKSLQGKDIEYNEYWANTLCDLKQLPYSGISKLPDQYTEFRKSVEHNVTIGAPLPVPATFKSMPSGVSHASIGDYSQLDQSNDDDKTIELFKGGETQAWNRVKLWMWDQDMLKTYKTTRNGLDGLEYSSKFSPWLAHGCISAKSIFAETQRYEAQRVTNESTYWLTFELLWRDYFAFYALKYRANLFKAGGPRRLLKDWVSNDLLLNAWRDGTTGYPFIDAIMRQLTSTGYISNRSRQITASFLVNDCGIDWRRGAEHFEDQLVDYDVGSNWGNWSYLGGVGADSRQDRYFSLGKQGFEYDPDAKFVKAFVPEVRHLPSSLLLGCGDIPGYLSRACELKHPYRKGFVKNPRKENHGAVPGKRYR